MNAEHTIEDIYPLSPMQQGMLFHSLLAPESGVYLIQFVCTLTGSLDTTRFQQAWNEVVARHTVLRTEFDWSNSDEFLQLVHRHVQLPFAVLDWRYQPNDEPAVTAFLQADRARGIALDQAPLMRVTLLRISDDITQLVWSIHHLLIDGWCLNLVLRDVFSLYESLRWGQRPSLPAAQPYRNYIAWLQQQDLQRAETYWRTTLAGFRAPTALGWSKPDTTEPQGYASQRSALSAELSSAVRALARSREVTLNTIFQAAWAILLSRYSGDNDIVFGTTVAGRPPELPGADQIIGLFLNTLPLRTLVDPALPFSAWLSLIQANQSQAREFEYSALVNVQQWSDISPGQPLFQSIVVFENYPIHRSERSHQASIDLTNAYVVERTNLPLTVVIGTHQELSIKLMYEEAMFSDKAITHILDQFVLLLEQIAAQPDQHIGSYQLLTSAARAVLPDPAATLEQPHYPTIPALIAMLAENQPDYLAISQHAQTWSYRDVVAASSQIARQLQPLAPNTVVAVTGQRSFGLIAAMLGVLQSGGTLLTIDPLLPAERQQRMLAEAQAERILLCNAAKQLAYSIPTLIIEPAHGAVVGVNPSSDSIALPDIQPEQRAYIFFTSGTTGVPKGVAGNHRGLSHFLDWQRNTFNVGPHDRAAQLTGLSFDVVLRDIFLPLSSGATLCLPDPDATPASAQTLEWIAAERITLVHSVPSLVQNWLTAGSPIGSLEALRVVFLAGEPLPDTLVEHWRTTATPHAQLVNLYGPTETTLAKCAYTLPKQLIPGIQPVGFALPHSQALVLQQQRRCGVGEVGEIVIRTPFRTQGYINAPEEQRFVANPFSADVSDLVYHTGDLGRYNENGELHILGRVDQQVKIRGVRVEPAEVANMLLSHPDVAAATVIAFTGPGGDKQLAGYVVPVAKQAAPLTQLELLAYLQTRLPNELVPTSISMLEHLPVTANGKIDRAALPDPLSALQQHTQAIVAPRTTIEATIAEIWSHLLHRSSIGVYDNFFMLGGHSLIATQALARIRDAFDVNLPLREIFATPTIAELSKRVETMRQQQHGLRIPPLLATADRSQRFPLTFQQEFRRLNDARPRKSVSVRLRRLRLPLDLGLLEQSINALMARHENLRTGFPIIDGRPVMQISPELRCSIPFIDLRHVAVDDQDAQQYAIINEWMNTPFDLNSAPVFRVGVIQRAEQDFTLVVLLHMLITDGWSAGIFFNELMELYQAFRTNTEPRLQPLPVQYADFALWQREWLNGPVLDHFIGSWVEQLRNAPPIFGPRVVQALPYTSCTFEVSAETTARLRGFGRSEGLTTFTLLFGALNILLNALTDQTDVVINIVSANREIPEIQPLIGLFTNVVTIRSDLSGGISFHEALERARDAYLTMTNYQILPLQVMYQHDFDNSAVHEQFMAEELMRRATPGAAPSRYAALSHEQLAALVVDYAQVTFNFLPATSAADQPGHQGEQYIEAIASPAASNNGMRTMFSNLYLTMIENKNTIRGTLDYATTMFTPEQIGVLIDWYITLLDEYIQQPDSELSEIAEIFPLKLSMVPAV